MQLTLIEFAECMSLPHNTIERWIRQGRVPVKLRGDICLFNRETLEKWAVAHNLNFAMPGTRREVQSGQAAENLLTAIQRGGIYYDLTGSDVDEILWAAVDSMESVDEKEKKILHANLMEREEMMSTGIGRGVAIPHPRKPISDTLIPAQIAVCFLREEVEYNAVDKQPVFVLFVLVAPTAGQHLHLLSRISYCLRDNEFMDLLTRVPDPDTLLDAIAAFDNFLDSPEKSSNS